jgi:hypothetical protein
MSPPNVSCHKTELASPMMYWLSNKNNIEQRQQGASLLARKLSFSDFVAFMMRTSIVLYLWTKNLMFE